MKKQPCAHCNAKRGLQVIQCDSGEFAVQCSTCWACGPIGTTRIEAERYWNKRGQNFWQEARATYRRYLQGTTKGR